MRKWSAVATTTIISALVAAAPASALVATWSTDATDSFSGSSCGETSQATVPIRANAYAVSVVRPVIRTKLTDDSTGQTDATITAIRRTSGGMTFTATGSDDVCAHPDRYSGFGWETNNVSFRLSYKTRERVVHPSACNDPAYRPQRIIIACGDGSLYVDHLRWSSWNDNSARGVGTAHANDCTPNCAAGHFHAYKHVVVRLYHARYCSAHDDFEFTGVRYDYTRGRPAGQPRMGFVTSGCAAPARSG